MKKTKLPDEQEKIQHNMKVELPAWPRLASLPLMIYCKCGNLMNSTDFNYCQRCGEKKIQVYY